MKGRSTSIPCICSNHRSFMRAWGFQDERINAYGSGSLVGGHRSPRPAAMIVPVGTSLEWINAPGDGSLVGGHPEKSLTSCDAF